MAVETLMPGLVRYGADDSQCASDADLGVLLDLKARLDNIEWVHDKRRDNSGGEPSSRFDRGACKRYGRLSALEGRIHPRHHCGGARGRNCCGFVVGCGVIIVGAFIA
jgi:hypothetical protein